MYNSSQYCHMKSRLNKEELSVGGSLKKLHCKQCHLALNGVVKRSRVRCGKYLKAQRISAVNHTNRNI